MIGYTTVGTNDLAAATKFYDELFAVLGAKRLMEVRGGPRVRYIGWDYQLLD